MATPKKDTEAQDDFEAASPQLDAYEIEGKKHWKDLAEAYAVGVRDALSWASGDLGEEPAPTAARLVNAATAAWETCDGRKPNRWSGPQDIVDEPEEEEDADDAPVSVTK